MKSNLLIVFDIDGTIANVNDRFISSPPYTKDRKDPEYQVWLDMVQTPELLAMDTPVPGMQELVSKFEEAIYLTSRSEKILKETLTWLRTHNFPIRELIMRPNGVEMPAHEFKEWVITQRLIEMATKDGSNPDAYNVMIFDDDTSGKLEEVCHKRGWVLHKARSGGLVL